MLYLNIHILTIQGVFDTARFPYGGEGTGRSRLSLPKENV